MPRARNRILLCGARDTRTCGRGVWSSMNLQASFTQRRLRLLSGLGLFAYIPIPLSNHALGVIALALAESGRRVEMVLWRSPPITFLLYGAAAIHFSLALWTLYSRREWRL